MQINPLCDPDKDTMGHRSVERLLNLRLNKI